MRRSASRGSARAARFQPRAAAAARRDSRAETGSTVKLMIHEPSLIRMLVNAYQEIGLERGFNYTFLFNFSAEVESAVRHGLDPVWEQYIDQHLGEEMRSYGIDK